VWTFGRTAAPGRRGRRYWFAVLWFGLIFRSSTAPFASPHEAREVAADDRYSALANLKDRQLAVTRAAKWPSAAVASQAGAGGVAV